MTDKKHKIIVVGLPKTGTSTLAAMLRMLGYQVTGPEIYFTPDNKTYLLSQFEAYDGFQDYPWCFEWEVFKDDGRVLFVELKRDEDSWWQSFYNSYGGKGIRYLSYPYFNLEKNAEAKDLFIEFYRKHYQNFESFKVLHPERVLSINISTFDWNELCSFLNEPLPRTIFGKLTKKPIVNSNYIGERTTRKYKLRRKFRKMFLPLIGEKRWYRFVVFLRKNGLYGKLFIIICVNLLIS